MGTSMIRLGNHHLKNGNQHSQRYIAMESHTCYQHLPRFPFANPLLLLPMRIQLNLVTDLN
jgi:hypothetical protein